MSATRLIRHAVVAAALCTIPCRLASATTIDFEAGSASKAIPGLPAPVSVPASGMPYVAKGVTFSAVPIQGVTGINTIVFVQEQSALTVCRDPMSQNHVLGTGSIETLPIRADFPPGLVVTDVSVEVVTCLLVPTASLSLFRSDGVLLASAYGGPTEPGPGGCNWPIRAVSPEPVAYAIIDDASAGCLQCGAAGQNRCTIFWIDNFSFEPASGR